MSPGAADPSRRLPNAMDTASEDQEKAVRDWPHRMVVCDAIRPPPPHASSLPDLTFEVGDVRLGLSDYMARRRTAVVADPAARRDRARGPGRFIRSGKAKHTTEISELGAKQPIQLSRRFNSASAAPSQCRCQTGRAGPPLPVSRRARQRRRCEHDRHGAWWRPAAPPLRQSPGGTEDEAPEADDAEIGGAEVLPRAVGDEALAVLDGGVLLGDALDAGEAPGLLGRRGRSGSRCRGCGSAPSSRPPRRGRSARPG